MPSLEGELLGALAREEALQPDQPLALFPRLVLADWLEENLGPEGHVRAEFIRLQVACEEMGFPLTLPAQGDEPLLRLPGHLDGAGAAQALACRSQAVVHFAEHSHALLEPYPSWLREHLVFRGGLPWLCHVPWELWQHHFEQLRQDESLEMLASLRAWRFSSPIDGPHGFEPAAFIPGTPYSLEVSGAGAAVGLFRSGGVEGWLGSLRHLSLAHWALPKAMSMGMLPTSTRMPGLKHLHLPANQIEFDQMIDLGRAGLPRELESFSLARNRLSFEDSVVLLEEGWALPKLTRLDLSGTGVGLGVLYNLGRSPLCENLKELILSHGEIEETLDVEALLDASFHRLTELNLAGNRLTEKFLGILSGAAWLPNLIRLDLSEVPLGGEGWQALMRNLGPGLVELRQRNCGLEADSVGVIADSPARISLRHLDVRQNALGNEGFFQLLGHTWPSMVLLSLGLNSISAPIPGLDRRLMPHLAGLELERP